MIIYVPTSTEGAADVAAALRRAQEGYDGLVTVLSVFMGEGAGDMLLGDGISRTIPSYTFPEDAALALARAVRHGVWRLRDPGVESRLEEVEVGTIRAVIDRVLEELGPDGGWLEPADVDLVLQGAGLRTPRSSVASDPDEAALQAAAIGGPVVLKVVSESALHKSDVGGVLLDVEGDDAVRAGFEKVTSVVDDASGVLVQELIPGGHEALIGMTQDPNFGPLVVFGLGGVYVELLKDVAFRIHPLTDVDAMEMIREIKGFKILLGYRGVAGGDVDALESALLRVSGLISAVPELLEMDLNPVKVLEPGDGVCVVDARMKVKPLEDWKRPELRDLPGVRTT
jgi:acetyltransferase